MNDDICECHESALQLRRYGVVLRENVECEIADECLHGSGVGHILCICTNT
jgi:hypothetical protein